MKSAKIYVGNLPYDLDEHGVTELFAPYGAIKNVSLIVNRTNGQSKGFAFISFWNDKDANDALAMNGKPLRGRQLVVNYAMEKPQRKGNRLFRRRMSSGAGSDEGNHSGEGE